jgi:hypothetical protein
MAVRFDFKTLIFAGMLIGACSEEVITPPEGQGSETGNASADAGRADAGRADAGRKDAGAAPADDDTDTDTDVDEDDEAPVDTDDDDDAVDAGAKADAGGAKADAGGAKVDAGGSSGDACATLTYESFGEEFIDTYCASCHTAMDPKLTTLAQVKTNKAKIKAEAVDSENMPPKGAMAPSDAERVKLGQWLDCGPK